MNAFRDRPFHGGAFANANCGAESIQMHLFAGYFNSALSVKIRENDREVSVEGIWTINLIKSIENTMKSFQGTLEAMCKARRLQSQ